MNLLSNRSKQIVAIILLVVFTAGLIVILNDRRSSGEESVSEEIFAMDTVMKLTVYKSEGMVGEPPEVLEEMCDRVYQMENELSVTKKDSDIGKLNAASGTAVEVSEDTYDLIAKAKEIAEETGGSLEPTIYPIVKLWGFTTGEYKVPSESEIKNELKKVDYSQIDLSPSDSSSRRVRLDKDMEIDLGACAKGYLSDALCDILRKHKASSIVSLGGNVQSVGKKPDGEAFTVGIVNPKNTDDIFLKTTMENEAVITSGNYERFFEEAGKRYHHIMDSGTGAPADNSLASVTVIGPSGFYCDAYATAFYVMGEEKTRQFLESHKDYKAVLIRNDDSYWASENLNLDRS